MKDATAPVTKYRSDYRPSNFLIDEVHLTFTLYDEHTLVKSRLMLRRNPEGDLSADELKLDGEQLELLSCHIDGQPLTKVDYAIDEESLTIYKVKDQFELTTECKIYPHKNKSLEGLYTSNQKYCTQCEAEGFRKITYYLDRPDVLAKFFVRIEANKSKYPLLLSNGNPKASGDLPDERHYCSWEDPFPKPSYLFALVAGDLDLLEDTFTTKSGREVKLQLFVDKGKLDQSEFAMESLKNAMRWDEERYNLEYDLDLYMIVAVGDFNMGAMENKGLNIFNTKYVLANLQTATDQDFENIESVIGHEYFHNWTGNRVTCRDWFQLSLKEGLTVFRDQQFTEDMRSKAVKRIDDVKVIRSFQFAEDAGPMAHSIRPDSYIEMNNFYTVTVYNKGAEVIRMLHTLLGEEGFQKGMALYFERHDGSAATCDDFVAAMADANDFNLSAFKAWYSQAGTPELKVNFNYNAEKQELSILFNQSNSHPSAKQPYVIPVKVGLIGEKGESISFTPEDSNSETHEALLIVNQFEQEVVLKNVKQKVFPSLLRDFSAPVKLNTNLSKENLALLFAFDSNTFTRWDAGQTLMTQHIASDSDELLELIVNGFRTIINDKHIDTAFKARALSLPDLKTLFEIHAEKGVDHLVARHKQLKEVIARQLEDAWLATYNELYVAGDTNLAQEAVANRAIKNLALHYLALANNGHDELVKSQFTSARLMTDELAALATAVHGNTNDRESIVEAFYAKWKDEALVMDKWISVQATADEAGVIDKIGQLRKNPVFAMDNPNKVRSLFGSFASLNFAQFHASDGRGYALIADTILELDSLNPQVASSLAKQFAVASKLDESRQRLIARQLDKILKRDGLSKDVYEIVSKTQETL